MRSGGSSTQVVVREEGRRRRARLPGGEGRREPVGRGRHQRRVEGAAHLQGGGLGAALGGQLGQARDALDRPRGDHLPGAVVVGRPDVAGLGAERLGRRRRPGRAARASCPGAASAAACIAAPRSATRRRAASKGRLPATTRAEYSPRECPIDQAALQAVLGGDPPGGDGGRHQRRLADVGLGQALLGAGEADLRERVAEGVVGLLEGAPGDRRGVGERGAHADGLGALAGEEQADHAGGAPDGSGS